MRGECQEEGQSSRDKLVFVCEFELGGDIVEFLLFLLQVGVSKRGQDIKGVAEHPGVEQTHILHTKLVFNQKLTLVQSAELVDLVLVLPAHLDLVASHGRLVLL